MGGRWEGRREGGRREKRMAQEKCLDRPLLHSENGNTYRRARKSIRDRQAGWNREVELERGRGQGLERAREREGGKERERAREQTGGGYFRHARKVL